MLRLMINHILRDLKSLNIHFNKWKKRKYNNNRKNQKHSGEN
jgi:hypothetical protein